jgi:NADPH:quinone reductase
MKAVVFNQVGAPLDVLQLKEVPLPKPQRGQALVRMASASINPGDFLFMQKLYPPPKWPKFPDQIAGNHGAGIVEEINGPSHLTVGTLVAFSYYNTWADYAVVPLEWLIPLPADFALEKAGQLVNIISAYDLLKQVEVSKGGWLALTAGNATISVMTAQFARDEGLNVISIVRRVNPQMDLKQLGSTAVLESTTPDLKDRIKELTGGKGLNGFIDHVGGPATAEIMRSMAFGGKVVINGVMSEEGYHLHNLDILMRGLQITSYVYRYFFNPPTSADQPFLEHMVRNANEPWFKIPLGGSYPLNEFRHAVEDTLNEPQKGKRLFHW